MTSDLQIVSFVDFATTTNEKDGTTHGVIHVETPEVNVCQERTAIYFNVDKSGSMEERCVDGVSKMVHIKHVLKNILRFIVKSNANIVVHIVAFDELIESVLDGFTLCNADTIDEMCQKIDGITPDGSTDIGLALTHAVKEILDVKATGIQRVYHIHLTDGQATIGEDNPHTLSTIVSDCNVSHTFIGFGESHDSMMLSHIAAEIPECCGEYRFVDKMESSGLVYGEVIYNILYPCLNKCILSISGGEVYNWNTNTWNRELYIPYIAGSSKKVYHTRSSDNANFRSCITDVYGRQMHKIHHLPDLIDMHSGMIVENELRHYTYRQCTLALLFEVTQFLHKKYEDNRRRWNLTRQTPLAREPSRRRHIMRMDGTEKSKLKEQLQSQFRKMQKYRETLTTPTLQTFMKVLMDDVYVAARGLDMDNGYMYSCGRQSSQGRQNAYFPSISSSDTEEYSFMEDSMGFDTDDDTVNCMSSTGDVFDNYIVSLPTTTTYMSSELSYTMSEIDSRN